MKKICLLFSFLIGISSVSAWESNLKIECINENLEPCPSSNMISSQSNKNSDIESNKSDESKKKVVKKIIKKEQKEKVVKKIIKKEQKENVVTKIIKKEQQEKVVKKKRKKEKEKIKLVNVKNDNISFEEFKNLVINYSNTVDYPDISN